MTSLAQRMNRILRENPYFIAPSLIYFAITLIALTIFPKGTLILWFGKHNSIIADYAFFVFTYLGDGVVAVLVSLLLTLFRSVRIGIICVCVYAASGITAQILKRIVDMPRPKGWFPEGAPLHYMDGLKIYSAHSFPSGHSVTAFALFLILSVITKDKRWGAVFFLLAFLTGLSRVYLAQHFYADVLAGSALGFLFALVGYSAFGFNSEAGKLDRPLLKLKSLNFVESKN